MFCALQLAYKGTAYCGWQVQPNARSVQETLQDAMLAAFGTRGTVTGCSRTDAGVHARGFVCRVDGLPDGLPIERLPEALGAMLPGDIAVKRAFDVPASFHPRYDALGKEYSYRIRNARVTDPFSFEYAALWPWKLDEAYADTLCKQLVGTWDYASFMAAGSKVEDTVRTVTDFSCKREGEDVVFSVSANGFLYHMVRILVGTVLELHTGNGLCHGKTAEEILLARSRPAAGRTMPAKGLCLEKVFYCS